MWPPWLWFFWGKAPPPLPPAGAKVLPTGLPGPPQPLKPTMLPSSTPVETNLKTQPQETKP